MSAQRKTCKKMWLVSGLACLLLILAGLAARPVGSAAAAVRPPSAPRENFKSGAQRSEAILAEILTTLKNMDARLARIEKSINTAAGNPRIAAPRGTQQQP